MVASTSAVLTGSPLTHSRGKGVSNRAPGRPKMGFLSLLSFFFFSLGIIEDHR